MNRKPVKRLNNTPNRVKLSIAFMKDKYQEMVNKYIDKPATPNCNCNRCNNIENYSRPLPNEPATPNCNCNRCTTQNESTTANPNNSTSSNQQNKLLQEIYQWKAKVAAEKTVLVNKYTSILEQLDSLAENLASFQTIPIQTPVYNQSPSSVKTERYSPSPPLLLQ